MAKAPATKPANRVTFAFLTETKNALRFEEVSTDGKAVPIDKASIGSLYCRKAQFGAISAEYASHGTIPKLLVVTIEAA